MGQCRTTHHRCRTPASSLAPSSSTNPPPGSATKVPPQTGERGDAPQTLRPPMPARSKDVVQVDPNLPSDRLAPEEPRDVRDDQGAEERRGHRQLGEGKAGVRLARQ